MSEGSTGVDVKGAAEAKRSAMRENLRGVVTSTIEAQLESKLNATKASKNRAKKDTAEPEGSASKEVETVDPTDEEMAREALATRELGGYSVLTWNVWFGDGHEGPEVFKRRCDAVVTSLGRSCADFICLQEVTEGLLTPLLKAPWVTDAKTGYVCSTDKIQTYGVLILCRRSLKPQFSEVCFPTRMGRTLHTAKVGSLVVGCVHLESLSSASTRYKQIQISFQALRALGCTNEVLCGDFNFCSYRNFNPEITPLENECLPQLLPGYLDLWPTLEPKHKGYTFDSESNTNVYRYERMRYDRVMACCTSLMPRSISRYGTREVDLKIPDPEPQLVKVNGKSFKRLSISRTGMLHMSDHFGLLACLRPLKEGEAPMQGMAKRNPSVSGDCLVG